MTDRGHRIVLGLLGALLLIGGGLAVLSGAGAFGTTRRQQFVFDSTVVRWWNEGGWLSYAVVVAIGIALLVIGLWMALAQLRRHEGAHHMSRLILQDKTVRGETSLRSAAGAGALETDLGCLTHVQRAKVELFDRSPAVELRAALNIDDDTNLDRLTRLIDEAVGRFTTTTGIAPDPVRMTFRYVRVEQERRLA